MSSSNNHGETRLDSHFSTRQITFCFATLASDIVLARVPLADCSTSAHAISCPKLHSTASRPPGVHLVVAPLGSRDATSSSHLTTVHPENLPSTTHSNLRRQCAMLGSIACASLFICICTGEKRTTRLPPLTLNIG
jgi:hypothetical protein